MIKKQMNKPYDYSEDFSPEELYEEDEDQVHYESLEDKLRDIGMSIHDFI